MKLPSIRDVLARLRKSAARPPDAEPPELFTTHQRQAYAVLRTARAPRRLRRILARRAQIGWVPQLSTPLRQRVRALRIPDPGVDWHCRAIYAGFNREQRRDKGMRKLIERRIKETP